MKNIRVETCTLQVYLNDMKGEKIRTDQECQRLSGQWNCNMVNELIATVLMDNYIPPIIMGEKIVDGIARQWIIDGLQRSSSLFLFRYGNVKITRNLDEYMVAYETEAKDEEGNVMRNQQGEIIWKKTSYDIRNKTYEQLPKELKRIFDKYQMQLVIHQRCDTREISKLVRRYNNHRAMNQAQRAFTYIDNFAREIRKITDNIFCKGMFLYTSRDRMNGTFERTVGDMVILCNYPDHYRKDTKASFKWLNENAVTKDFDDLDKLLVRLTESTALTSEIRELFNKKNAYAFVAAFKNFIEKGGEDKAFGKFLHWFVGEGKYTKIGENTWLELDINRSTRDSKIVHGKIDYLIRVIQYHVRLVI